MDQSLILPAALAIGVVLIGLMFIGEEDKGLKRASEISSSGTSSGNGGIMRFLRSDDSSNRRKQIEESLGKLEEEQKNKAKKKKSLGSKILQANWTIKPQTFLMICAGLALVAGGVPFVLGQSWKLCLGMAIGFGFGIPNFWLSSTIKRRQKKFTAHFADAMEIIVRGVRTGLPLGDCLKIIAHESPEPVRTEFQLVVEGESVGVPIEVCLERMAERMPLSEVNFFATVLNIQRSTGGNLGESLSNLAKVLRGRKVLRQKIKALSAEAKMSAGIIAALPPIIMVLITMLSPDYMTELYTTAKGQKMLMIGASMMVMGTLVMRKMINFKV
jgi:tight adherence protein B